MKSFFADIHCHTTLRPYNMLKGSVWYEKIPIIDSNTPIANYSQASMIQLAESNVKVAFASLYPIERGFFIIDGHQGEGADLLINLFLKFPTERVNEVTGPNHDYFQDLVNEYEWFKKDENTPYKSYSFKIATCYNDIKQQFSIDDNFNVNNSTSPVVMVVLTIEGIHSLGCGQENTKEVDPNDPANPQTQALLNKLISNIQTIKNWNGGKHCPFFITFCHHFWNQLCGHSISLAKIANKLMDQDSPYNPTFNTSFTYLGQEVIKELLKPDGNGKRILVDTKHMTVSARQWYYQYALDNNIPVITSHSAGNGYVDIATSHEMCDSHNNADKKYRKSKTFNNWDINISKEEIKLIVKTGGLIGFNMDQRILTGNCQLNTIKIEQFLGLKRRKQKLWAKPLVNNIIEIAQTLAEDYGPDDNRIWEHITIGSDYDGMIDPLREYKTCESFPDLMPILCELLSKQQDLDILKNKTDQQIQDIVEGFQYKNALRFLSRNY
jgi:microsomal dipeptidase-like Zn-dependent dipeptidase